MAKPFVLILRRSVSQLSTHPARRQILIYRNLLPWVSVDAEALTEYESRPHCRVPRDWLRLGIKTRAKNWQRHRTPASTYDILGLLAYFVRTLAPSMGTKSPVTFWATGLTIKMEQAKRLELSTSTLARWCSTN